LILPFTQREASFTDEATHWLQGGYPRSLLAKENEISVQWREDYIRTFLERDIPQLGFRIPANTLGRFWNSIETIAPDQTVVIAPVEGEYPIADHVMVMPLHAFVNIV
jgi:predicted AAA+ superfamily ATPase